MMGRAGWGLIPASCPCSGNQVDGGRTTTSRACRGPPVPPPRIAVRIRIVLRAADGRNNREIAKELRTSTVTVGLWRRRYAMLGFEGIRNDSSRSGGKRRLTPELVRTIVETTLLARLPGGGQWSSRQLAEHLGVSHTTIQRVWRLHRLPRKKATLATQRRPP
jgi:hypothetical protein